jgi:hypothetical protein
LAKLLHDFTNQEAGVLVGSRQSTNCHDLTFYKRGGRSEAKCSSEVSILMVFYYPASVDFTAPRFGIV